MAFAYRFFNSRSGEHFYTVSRTERDAIIATMPAFSYEGGTFAETGAEPVARFVRRDTGTHFFTANPAERDYVLNNLSSVYRLESSSAFTVSSTPSLPGVEGARLPVYRFYNTRSGSHFFTASAVERDVVKATLPQYQLEGIAFYVAAPYARPPAPSGALDESWYLSAYPDVRDAVARGITTARAHYEAFGRREGRMPNDMAALAGDDSWTAFDSAPGYVRTLNGGSGNDTLNGTIDGNDDLLFGETGDDLLFGADNDTLAGGSGDDMYIANSSGVRIGEGRYAGTDTVYVPMDNVSGGYNYTIPANVEMLRLGVSLTAWVPVVTGSADGDWIGNGGFGILSAVRLSGGAGNDTLNGGAGGALVEGGAGDDYILAVANVRQTGLNPAARSGNDIFDGGAGNDTLVAWGGNDRFTGGAGNDTILIDPGSPPRTLWQDPQVANAYTSDPVDGPGWISGTTTVTDFTPNQDVLAFRHTTLDLAAIMARFQDRSGGTPALQATFTAAELGLPALAAAPDATLTLLLEGGSKSQMTAGWFSVSS